MISAVFQHLLVSTLFAVLITVIVWVCHAEDARFRYRLWLTAVLNFAIPTIVFAKCGARLQSIFPVRVVVHSIDPYSATGIARLNHTLPQLGSHLSWIPVGLVALWFLGFVGFLLVWIRQYRSQRPMRTEETTYLADVVRTLAWRLGIRKTVTVRSVMNGCDLALYGVWKPVILVPRSFPEFLDSDELEAVLAHELMHVRRRDNFTAIVVHFLTCIFWFHPALWWIEKRLIVERELACDEAVSEEGWSAGSYASGILKLCRFQFAEFLPGACGFSGSSLRERMERIMSYKRRAPSKRRSIILAALGALLTLVPAAVGFISAAPTNKRPLRAIQQHNLSCVFADKYFPEGSVIREDGGHEQLCVEAFGRPLWVRTSLETRLKGQTVTEVPEQPIAFCTPKLSSSNRTCTCEEGGGYSTGSTVHSPNGALSCAAGKWKALPRTTK